MEHSKQYPSDFIDIQKVLPGISTEILYATKDNVTGYPLSGYIQKKALLRTDVAKALCAVQIQVGRKGYALHIFDAYRPQRAVNDMVKWAKNTNPHYLEMNYIADRSNHSRGIAIDLTLAEQSRGSGRLKPVDMGTEFDDFSERSHTENSEITNIQKKNRKTLLTAMHKAGFKNYHREWWHFTYAEKKYPEIFYDFPIR